MAEQLFKLILFFIFGLIYFYSVAGYGSILSKKNSNIFEQQFDGNIILLIFGYILYLTIGFSSLLNLSIIILGLILFLKKRKKNIPKLRYIVFLFASLFSILIISKTHEDFNNYHYFSIFEVFNNGLRIGVSKINTYWIHSSLLKFNQALIVLPFLNFNIIHLPIFIIYLSTVGYFILVFFKKTPKKNELHYSLLCVLILLIKFNRLSEFGYDYISQFLLLVVFHKIYFFKKDKIETSKAILYFIFSVLIKPISLLFFPILFFIFFNNGYNFYKKINRSYFFSSILLLLIFFSSSFLKTGCVFYPINSTCFDKEKIFWSEKQYLNSYSRTVELWSKSYDAQLKNTIYEKIENKEIYLENFNWVKFWIESHFFYKVYEFILIVSSLIMILYFLFSKLELNKNKKTKNEMIILLFSSLGIFFWFITVPQFRFGFSFIVIFIFFIFNFLINLNLRFDKKKFFYLIFLSLLILNTKNFIRIKNEFLRNDFYKFTNFPFYNQKLIEYDYSNLKRDKFFYIELLK